jgi:hypothetical protein
MTCDCDGSKVEQSPHGHVGCEFSFSRPGRFTFVERAHVHGVEGLVGSLTVSSSVLHERSGEL